MGMDAMEQLRELVRAKAAGPQPPLPDCVVRRAVRLEAGLTLREMGDAVGVSLSAVRGWEEGGDPSSLDIRARYAEALAVLVDETARLRNGRADD